MAWESAAMDTAGGKNQRRRPSTGAVRARNFSAYSRATAGPWFIFQLAANMSGRADIPLSISILQTEKALAADDTDNHGSFVCLKNSSRTSTQQNACSTAHHLSSFAHCGFPIARTSMLCC